MAAIFIERRQSLVAENRDDEAAVYYAARHPQQRGNRLGAKRVFATVPTEIATSVRWKRRLSQKKIEFRRSFPLETVQDIFRG